MAVNANIRDAVSGVFDSLRGLFFEGSSLTLCKASSTADAFTEVAVIDAGWFLKYDKFRQAFVLEIAADSDELTDAMADATHVKVDDDYYLISAADTLPPKGLDLTWKIVCQRFTQRGQFKSIY